MTVSPLHITFDSSHVRGDYRAGRLTIGIQIEDDTSGQSIWDEIYFEVPPDFHTHNDAVAAALMTLAGTHYQDVTFNFPTSSFCAETWEPFYPGVEVGPVDLSLEPRRPGRRIGLNYSGGLDSTAALALLRRVANDDLAIITSAYPGYHFEERGYRHQQRDVTCRTNLRQKRLDRHGRFNCAVPLLFAEYLGLGSFTTGHTINQSHDCLALPGEIPYPTFLRNDLAVNAGGMDELHLVRSLHNHGLSRLLMKLAPEWIEQGLSGTQNPWSEKYYTKAQLVIYLFEDAGLPLPRYLTEREMPRRPIPFGIDRGMDLRILHIAKRSGRTWAQRICPDIRRFDLSFLNGLELRFFERYHPAIADLIPQALRRKVIDIFNACGIVPYDERDWQEIAVVREFLRSHRAVYLRPGD